MNKNSAEKVPSPKTYNLSEEDFFLLLDIATDDTSDWEPWDTGDVLNKTEREQWLQKLDPRTS